jgi:hypothetical protein
VGAGLPVVAKHKEVTNTNAESWICVARLRNTGCGWGRLRIVSLLCENRISHDEIDHNHHGESNKLTVTKNNCFAIEAWRDDSNAVVGLWCEMHDGDV